MANEATEVELYGQNNSGDKRRYTCASATAITKGTLLKLTDPRTVAACDNIQQPFAGIAAMDKASDDYSTSISAWTNLIAEMKASGAIAVGQYVRSAPTNYVIACSQADLSSSYAIIVGYTLEAADNNEVINVRVGPL